MGRGILLALVAALALAIGFNTAASAGVGADAQATAKKKAAKKNCGKKKAKKKAGKSLADSAAKKKGKKKASGCKPKAKKKGKAKAKPTPPKQDPKGPTGAAFGDGVYKDAAQSVTITVTSGGQQATIGFPGGDCLGNALINVQGPIAQQGSDIKGSGTQSMLGGFGSVSWALAVSSSNLSYKFDATANVQFPGENPCQSAKNAAGTLVKQ
jgi:hypothetical protein